MFLTCGKITLYLCQPYSHVDPLTLFFLVHNPISFKAGLDESDLYGHPVVAGSLV